MDAFALNSDEPYGVRSLSLEEIVTAPPPLPLWRRILRFFRIAVMAWGVISLGAVAGMTAYYLKGEPSTALLVSESQAPAEVAPTKPKPDRVAVAVDSAPAADAVFAPAALPELSRLEISPQLSDARLPRPRPDEPIITGSLGPARSGPPRYDPDYVPTYRRRIANPCTTLRHLGAPIRCGNQARVYSPPPPPPVPEYYPRPYQPPVYRN
jgi:hypothetical protein